MNKHTHKSSVSMNDRRQDIIKREHRKIDPEWVSKGMKEVIEIHLFQVAKQRLYR